LKRPSFIWWRERRGKVFIIILAVLCILIELKLAIMQVIQQPAFLQQAAANRLRADIVEPARGRILDTYGRLLVDNRPIYTVYALPWTLKRNPASRALLANILELDSTTLVKRLSQRGWNTFQPTPLLRDVPISVLARLEAVKLDLPGVSYQLESKRYYPLPQAVHFLGYIGEPPPAPKGSPKPKFGLIGKRGVEKTYEQWLGGVPGVRFLEVDANGRVHGEVADPPPVPPQAGWNLELCIDAELQKYAFELLDGRNGAVIAMDPRTGGVLTMLSEPDYDPEVFAGVLTKEVWNALQNDPARPLLNRAIQGLYPPGSTFKMAILSAGFEEGIATDGWGVSCGGGLQVGNRRFGCWQKRGHGGVTWVTGLQRSCDVFFYTLGLRLGAVKMGAYIQEYGFGARTGIDLDGEVRGIAPTEKYLNRRYGPNGWSKGLLANISIGQGEVTVTPIQLAVFTSAIASGWIAKPHLGKELQNPVTGEIKTIDPELRPLHISQATLVKVREAMRWVVNEPGGTAYLQRRPDIMMCGKTGTAQNPHGKDHGLFVGYAPFEEPIIAVAVVVEHGEHGATTAAPLACSLMERYIYDLYPGPRQLRAGYVPPPKPVTGTTTQPSTPPAYDEDQAGD
jgi:penicillin-binding protein 2